MEQYRRDWSGVLATFDGPGARDPLRRPFRDVVQLLGIEVRAGLHAGEIELRGDDLATRGPYRCPDQAKAGAGEFMIVGSVPPLVASASLSSA